DAGLLKHSPTRYRMDEKRFSDKPCALRAVGNTIPRIVALRTAAWASAGSFPSPTLDGNAGSRYARANWWSQQASAALLWSANSEPAQRRAQKKYAGPVPRGGRGPARGLPFWAPPAPYQRRHRGACPLVSQLQAPGA